MKLKIFFSFLAMTSVSAFAAEDCKIKFTYSDIQKGRRVQVVNFRYLNSDNQIVGNIQEPAEKIISCNQVDSLRAVPITCKITVYGCRVERRNVKFKNIHVTVENLETGEMVKDFYLAEQKNMVTFH